MSAMNIINSCFTVTGTRSAWQIQWDTGNRGYMKTAWKLYVVADDEGRRLIKGRR